MLVAGVVAAPAGAAAVARDRAAAAASPAAAATVRAWLWRKGGMTFTLLEARLGGAASAGSARWATAPSSHARGPDRGSAARQTALTGPTETVASGASGRTFSPHLE